MVLQDIHLQTASKTLNISVEDLRDAWPKGNNILIPAFAQLDDPVYLEQKTLYLHEGIVREYFIDSDGSEHTLRIVLGPAYIAPSMNSMFREDQQALISQSLTPLKGRTWDLEFMLLLTTQNPIFFRTMIKTIIDALSIKAQKDVRRTDSTAQERYHLFTKEFPVAVNLIPLKYIASYLNMTAETISRIRNNISKRLS